MFIIDTLCWQTHIIIIHPLALKFMHEKHMIFKNIDFLNSYLVLKGNELDLHILIYFILIYSSSSNLKYYLNAINFLQLSVSAICSQFHWKTSKSNELQLKRLVYSCIMHDCKIFRVYEKNENWPTSNCLYKRGIEQYLNKFVLYWSVLFIRFKTH